MASQLLILIQFKKKNAAEGKAAVHKVYKILLLHFLCNPICYLSQDSVLIIISNYKAAELLRMRPFYIFSTFFPFHLAANNDTKKKSLSIRYETLNSFVSKRDSNLGGRSSDHCFVIAIAWQLSVLKLQYIFLEECYCSDTL